MPRPDPQLEQRSAASTAAAPLRWLVGDWQWPYGAAFAACFLLALAPFVWSGEGLAAALIFVQLPLYMLHQLEEHRGDRFRRFANERLGGEALTPMLTFAINLVAVWGVMAVALYLAFYVDPALGLIAVYLTLANALLHVLPALAMRSYNPGLWTALGLFGPFGLWAAIEINAAYEVSPAAQASAISVAILGHVAVVATVAARLR